MYSSRRLSFSRMLLILYHCNGQSRAYGFAHIALQHQGESQDLSLGELRTREVLQKADLRSEVLQRLRILLQEER